MPRAKGLHRWSPSGLQRPPGQALSGVTCLFLTRQAFEQQLATGRAIACRWPSVAHAAGG
jgi:hypothetical protein